LCAPAFLKGIANGDWVLWVSLVIKQFIFMATYTYETIPQKPGQKARRFEVEQKMSDAPLKCDPESGLPVRRIITGGSGLITRGASILSMNKPKR
jgi:predicted nucleic acid-binding Zn ribbon protein